MLARELKMTAAELDARMSIRELARWRAFFAWEVWEAENRAATIRARQKDRARG